MAEAPDPYEHFRTTETADVDAGIYRVVGTSDGEVTLLRLTDGDGVRRRTGDLVRLPVADLEADFEAAADPDGGFSPTSFLRGLSAMVKRLIP